MILNFRGVFGSIPPAQLICLRCDAEVMRHDESWVIMGGDFGGAVCNGVICIGAGCGRWTWGISLGQAEFHCLFLSLLVLHVYIASYKSMSPCASVKPTVVRRADHIVHLGIMNYVWHIMCSWLNQSWLFASGMTWTLPACIVLMVFIKQEIIHRRPCERSLPSCLSSLEIIRIAPVLEHELL